MKNRKTHRKSKVELPTNFQEKLSTNEKKYEKGERSSYLLKEMISLYQNATEYYVTKKNRKLSEFFSHKYNKLLEQPDTLTIIEDTQDKQINMESTRSSNKPSDKHKLSSRNSKLEEKLLTLNDTVLGKNYFTLGKILKKEYNTSLANRRNISCISETSKKVLTNSDETALYGCKNNMNQTKTVKAANSNLFRSENYKKENIKFIESNESQEIELKNYRSNDLIYNNKLNDDNPINKTFRKIKTLQVNKKLENQINDILFKLSKADEKFDLAVSNDLNQQREKFLEMKKFKKEEQITQSNSSIKKGQKIKKFLRRRGSNFEEIYKSLMSGQRKISEEDLMNELILFIEKQILVSHKDMNEEIESFISKNIKEMNSAIQELEESYGEDIRKFEENGSIYADVIEYLKGQLKEEIRNIREKYEENRAIEIKRIKTNYLKNV